MRYAVLNIAPHGMHTLRITCEEQHCGALHGLEAHNVLQRRAAHVLRLVTMTVTHRSTHTHTNSHGKRKDVSRRLTLSLLFFLIQSAPASDNYIMSNNGISGLPGIMCTQHAHLVY
jgi:hypothetical protein